MKSESTGTTPRKRSAGATRERILEAATRLFYTHGIRATSADRIIEEVGITKVTFYRHFHTKSDLVVAYLTEQATQERDWFSSMRTVGDPVCSLRAIAAGIGEASCSPGFRGCAFINAAAEFSDPGDPVREVVDTHRQWMLGEFASMTAEAGVDDPQQTARQLMMLRDGAMVSGYLGGEESIAASLDSAFDALLTAELGREERD
ncbi:TetR/AcrR family transcriptional regulator [Brevibacterium sp. 91QC2O2]|uniref:TetR/AcrR family transcriptional regulator n=1 Tax=Brevibacterium sp. 91QC2O2 TaxID=2968458 RepID=UPI00211CE040|nr:TetR/AcrR family transcriptional regulator [Brevibacterium sp. 91QC2O2]MCQ9366719.1 TetR/AcrR family transcriptional regulator [Brevibacterium sp. 91QC2O2]